MTRQKLVFAIALCCASFAQATTPERIVSTSGNASEEIARFGLADHLVAVDTTSIIPIEVMKDKPKVGYRRQLSAEGILSMNPDLVILAPDAGPTAVVKQLEGAGIPLFYLQDEQTLAGINADIKRLGDVLEVEQEAEALIAEQVEQAEALTKNIAAYPRTPKLLMLIDTGDGALFALGKDSAGAHMTEVLAGEPSLSLDGMKPVSKEALLTDQADVVLLATRNDARDLTVIKPLTSGRYDALDHHKAMSNGCVFQVNIMKALGFGPDTADVANTFAKHINECLNKSN
ncbi:ABC transporter substrate-binding protein [Suttonella sp. R2A3]|uniref:heme/hemin ABC transporter substrate-binding protein n=1 Tax=Suttonella sp. R2A3 TaxID=2908648 RepID=UPI001F27DFC6|nr:ABC transporter substrate-binding protein [Suttonella sp. R2A3]UJF25079.1 ABC transporter substrate-binding protein [Suttonella sp. R2A3]